MIQKVVVFFDKLEDLVRARLSHWPILYSFIGGVGIVLFWKGVWEMAEYYPILFGFPSVLIGLVILLSTGLLVSFFIGDNIILSGLKHEKKVVEKTETEVQSEKNSISDVLAKLETIEKKLEAFQKAKKPRKGPVATKIEKIEEVLTQ
ncbi:MAG: hypothetical protein NT019_03045 [Candidatus Adlerbacteria bacterium]|nr:hypothetical protein [Candidatus Adlerbacteria bacterium]